jgi:hypothetical protein
MLFLLLFFILFINVNLNLMNKYKPHTILQYKEALVPNETILPAGLTQSTKGIELIIGTTTYYFPLFTAT